MYKLKLSKGELIVVNDTRRNYYGTFELGKEYPQETLKRFYDGGFKFVTNIQDKKQNTEPSEG